MNEYKCPHCGGDVSEVIKGMASKGGKAKTPKKLTAQRTNMEKLNATYTAEKRKAAAAKRAETIAKKKLNTP